ncbi:MAG TPA: FAD binding domain-containing protein [Steroidobacteraceae bacterium]|nr:FAD binding domain-containing protein [Steroidobacteraceae bacterium]HRX88395.1 FAD binding domain-containing protein [Steroidobacteraceae bacterium]
MSLHPQYARPRSAAQAVEVLGNLGAGAVVIAGGQELMPHVNYGRLMPTVYVDIAALPELAGITEKDGEVAIGALTVHRTLQRDAIVQRALPLLAHAAAQVGGGWQVHNRGTVGGNLVAMHPLYDIAPVLLALQADVEIQAPEGVRRAALGKILAETSHGLGTSSLLTRILLKPMQPDAGWAYEKLKITAGSYGSANAAAVVSLTGNKLSTLRVVIGAVSEQPLDASEALHGLLGKPWDAVAGARVESLCSASPKTLLDDQQGDATWRRAMAGVVARRAVQAAVANAQRTNK